MPGITEGVWLYRLSENYFLHHFSKSELKGALYHQLSQGVLRD